MENAYIDVRPGQIWADNDPRSVGRKLRVDSVEGEYAFCTVTRLADNVYLGLYSKKKLLTRRFRPTSTGYLLLEDPSTGYVRPQNEPLKWVKPENARGAALVPHKVEAVKDGQPRKKKIEKPTPTKEQLAASRADYEKAENARVAMPVAAPALVSAEVAWEAEVPVDFICMIHPKYPTDSETVDNYYAKNAKKIWDAARADLLSA